MVCTLGVMVNIMRGLQGYKGLVDIHKASQTYVK